MCERWLQSQPAHRWLGISAAIGLVAHLRAVVPAVARPRPPTLVDTALYEHAGWYLTQGARLYLDIWEPKPPLPYETTAILSLLARGDPYGQHLLAVVVSTAASIASLVVLAVLASALTGRRDAGIVAGLTPLLLPAYITVPALGFSPKHFVVLTGLLAILFARRDRPAASGVMGACCVGFWHPAIAFPGIALGVLWRRTGARSYGRFIAAGTATAGVILAPVVLWGAVPAMVAETVVIPLATPEPHTLVPRVGVAVDSLGPATVGIVLGGVAMGLATRRPYRGTWWWVVVGGGWFGVVAYAFDYDAATDAFPSLVFVALGLAFLTATIPRARPVLLVGTGLLVALSVVSFGGGVGGSAGIPATRPLASLAPIPIPGDGISPPVRELFWERRIPESCHYRVSVLERRWLRLAGYSERCGRVREALDLLAGRY